MHALKWGVRHAWDKRFAQGSARVFSIILAKVISYDAKGRRRGNLHRWYLFNLCLCTADTCSLFCLL